MRIQKRNQDGLWKHMAKSCTVSLMSNEEYRNRKTLFESAIDDVNSGAYSPHRIHGFLSAPKGASVARFIPVLTYIDTAVYFACMQHIDKKLAGAAVEHTFGGWQLGSVRREIEEQEALDLFGGEGCPSMPPSCYNRAAWMQHWQEYWKLLAARYEHADDSAWFAMFDLANFYDSVNLRRLETSVHAIERRPADCTGSGHSSLQWTALYTAQGDSAPCSGKLVQAQIGRSPYTLRGWNS
jgi:hypothetical protein